MLPHFTARQLVTSNATLPATMLVKNLIDWFRAHPAIEYATVLDAEGICGLVSREAVNARIASNKFGFAVLAEKPVTKVMSEDPLIVEGAMTIAEVVKHLLRERADSPHFYEDIVVHQDGNFLGLASVKRLIVKQMEMIMEQMRTLEKQQQALTQKNKEMIEATSHLSHDHEIFHGFFEKCSIPIVVFEPDGRLVQANPRFFKLSGYTGESLSRDHAADHLFENQSFQRMVALYAQAKADADAYRPTFSLTLIKRDRQRQGVEVSFNVNETNGQIIVSILRNIDAQEMAVVEMMQRKVSNQGPLAQRVAENLIDKEYDLEAAMQKLDALINFADKIENKPNAAASSALLTETARLSLQNLNGALGQFSIVDLTQLLVQGRKSGHLVITQDTGLSGTVYFDHGLMVHAVCAEEKGRPALRHLMTIEAGTFIFYYDTPAPEHTISGSDPMSILLEACAENDEDTILPFSETYPAMA